MNRIASTPSINWPGIGRTVLVVVGVAALAMFAVAVMASGSWLVSSPKVRAQTVAPAPPAPR